ncbi:MAG TPA: hypothetical protein VEI49_06795 [Terriglobales bacterium]|nr:hypothetical protein [Terriglobales bacterium]
MNFRGIATLLMMLGLATLSVAQTKISGLNKCGKPDQVQKIDIGDKPDHAFAISQGKCTWTKAMEIGGTQTKEDVVTNSVEMSGAKAQVHGFVVGTLANGDKFYARTHGAEKYDKSGKIQSSEGSWSFVGGTGAVKSVKGEGTYSGRPDPIDPAGSVIFEISGEYEIPK